VTRGLIKISNVMRVEVQTTTASKKLFIFHPCAPGKKAPADVGFIFRHGDQAMPSRVSHQIFTQVTNFCKQFQFVVFMRHIRQPDSVSSVGSAKPIA
jgi:hypothetical protein